jgi:hypothetical protein
MVSALASAMAGQKRVVPLLQWDAPDQSEANAMTLEAVLKGAMKEDNGNSLRARSPRHR